MSKYDRLLLDTSAYSNLRRGQPDCLNIISEAGVVLMSTVVLGELEAGFRCGTRYEANAQTLEEFLEEPFVEVVELSAAMSRLYGRIFKQLRSAGTPIPVNDIWIAAMAQAQSAHLLTFDGDFRCVADLEYTLL